MQSKQRIPVLVCIDVEPEDRKLAQQAPDNWLGFEKSFEYFNALRPRLTRITDSPVHFSWFVRMDPQIAQTYGSAEWVVSQYQNLFKQLEEAGDEIGLHSHAWRWDTENQDWFVDHGDPDWVDHCISSACDAFHNSFSRGCKSFRFGDHWMSERGLDQLEKLGVKFDLTLEPGQAENYLLANERFTGSFPDCRMMPQVPYQPHVNNFTKPAFIRKRSLWLIPVSAEHPSTSGNGDETHKGMPYVPLNLAFDRSVVESIVERLLIRLSDPLLVIVARTDVASDPSQRANLEKNIDYLLNHPLAAQFSFKTPAEAINSLGLRSMKWLKQYFVKSNET